MKLLGDSSLAIKYLSQHDVLIILDTRDPAVSRPLLCTGRYEDGVTRALMSRVQPDTHFVDIGANVGYFSLLVANRAPLGRVFSFEPDPRNFRLLSAAICLNGLENTITARMAAVSDSDEPVYFSDLGYTASLGSRFTSKTPDALRRHATSEIPDPVQVDTVSLDSALSDERVDLLKVDIEGYEPHAFNGMRELLRTQHPIVVTEFAPGTIQHMTGTDPRDLLALFRELGYSVAILNADGTAGRGSADIDDIISRVNRGGHHVDLLLVPLDSGSNSKS